jgi:hypothetical protein
MGVASERLEQEKELLGKHGSSPGKGDIANGHRQFYAAWPSTPVIRITCESRCAFIGLRKNDHRARPAASEIPLSKARDQSARYRFPLRDVAMTI